MVPKPELDFIKISTNSSMHAPYIKISKDQPLNDLNDQVERLIGDQYSQKSQHWFDISSQMNTNIKDSESQVNGVDGNKSPLRIEYSDSDGEIGEDEIFSNSGEMSSENFSNQCDNHGGIEKNGEGDGIFKLPQIMKYNSVRPQDITRLSSSSSTCVKDMIQNVDIENMGDVYSKRRGK